MTTESQSTKQKSPEAGLSRLRVLPGQGIELSLYGIHVRKAFQQGGEFWEPETQRLLLSFPGLARFLPRVETSPRFPLLKGEKLQTALFQLMDGRRELMSQSIARGFADIPAAEIAALQEVLREVVSRSKTSECDPNARRIIEEFRLPDPVTTPEAYRVTALVAPADGRAMGL